MYCKVASKDTNELIQSNIIQQTPFWAWVKQKQGFVPYAFNFEANELLPFAENYRDTITDDILILLQYISFDQYIAYVPYGPERGPRMENYGKLLEELSEVLRSFLPPGCVLIRYDLPWKNTWGNEEDYYDENNDWIGPPGVKSQEMRVNFNTKKWNLFKSPTDILPSNTFFLDLTKTNDDLLARMKPKTRYNIRLSERKGVHVKRYSMEFVDQWYRLYRETSLRNGIALHPKEYFTSVLASQYAGVNSSTQVHLLMADYGKKHLAAMFLILSKNRGTYLYGASSNQNRNVMAAYALQWEAIQLAKKYGCTEYDLFGTAPNSNPGHPMHGLYRFKSGFGGKVFHRMGCWDYPINNEKYEIIKSHEFARKGYYIN